MDQHNKRGDRKEDEMDRGMAATTCTLEPGSSSKAEGKTAASEEQQSVLRCDASRPGAEERQPVLLYDASRPGAVMVKISGNETEVNVQTDAPVIIGPTTIISDSHASARQNEMDCLEHFRSDNRSLFVSTKAFVESAAVLDKDHVLVVTGAPGMGKTFICQQLLLQVCDEKQCSPFQPTKPKYYLKWCNTRERQAFLMNDVFGASSFNQAKYDAWMNVFPMMIQHLKSMNTYLLFACREDILNSHLTVLKMTGIFNNVINLSDDKYQLTEINKRDMFLNHTSTFKIDIKYGELENAEPQGRDPIGFPQRIHFFCSMVNVSNVTRMRYFINPMEYLSTVIGTYREDDHVAYCVLILLLLHDGHLPVSFFEYSNESSEQLKRCLHICDIPTKTTGALRSKADDLCNSLLLFVNDRYVYQHPSVMEAVTLDFGQRHPSDILSSCSVHFLLERVFTQTSAPPDNEYVVRLQPVMVPQLCARLVKEIAEIIVHHKVDTRSLASYAVFKDDAVVQLFLSHLQDAASLHLLLVSSSRHSPHPTFLFLAAASGQEALVREVLSSCDVQQLPGFSDHLDRVLYAACCSGSPAAVRALLASGARADYRTAHRPDEVRCGQWWWGTWWGTTTCTTLMHSAYSGSAEVLRLVIDRLQQQGVNVVEHLSIRDNQGRTALHWWVKGGRGADALQILLEAGAAIDARDDEGQTALHCSARLGDEAAVCALLEARADVHISSVYDGSTSLQVAVLVGHTAVANLLLSRMDPDDLDSWSAHTLGKHLVTKDSAPADDKHVVVLHPEKFLQLSAKLVKEIRRCVCAEGERSPCEGDALSSSSDGDHRTLRSLSTSRAFKDPAFLRIFLRHLQDAASLHLLLVSSSRHRPHHTFLFLAAASGQDALVCEVLSSCDVQRLPGFSDHLDHVLYAACCSGSPAAVRVLLAAGARADYRVAHAPDEVRDGRWRMTMTCTTLMHAAYSGSADVVRLVLDRLQQQGVDVVEQLSIRDDEGRTALHWWLKEGRGAADMLQILLEAGADIDARDDDGQTVLNSSAWHGDEATVCALLEARADVHISSDDGTSLWVAVQYGHTAAADLLLSRMDPDDLDSWSAQTLGKHLVTKHSAPADGKHIVVLQPEKFPQLSARLVKEIKRCVCAEGEGSPCEGDALSSSSDGDHRSLRSLSTSRVFKDPAFLRVFLHHLQDAASLHLLLASSSRRSQHLTFLFLAAASGQDALVCEVLSSRDVQQLPGFSDHLDRVLCAACCSGSPAAVRALLAAGARADYRTTHAPDEVRDGRWWWGTTTCTTLMHAAYSSSAEVVRLIIDCLQQQGVDVVEQLSIGDVLGRTALHWWADGGRGASDTLQILLDAGAAIDVTDDEGRTALNCSAWRGDEATACTLLEAGADVHISSDGTSLQGTVLGGHTSAANLLSRMDPDDLDSWSAQTLGKHLVTKDSAPADDKHVVVLHPEKFPQLSARLVKEIRRCVCAEGEGSPCEGDALSSSSDGDPRSLRSLSTSRVFGDPAFLRHWQAALSSSSDGDPRSLRSLSTCHVFKDPAFLRVFLHHLQDAASLHLLLASSSRRSPHPTFLFLAAASGQDALVREVLASRDVQQLPGFSDHLDRVLYAACYSRSPAAVRVLLVAGARADYRTAHAPDAVRHGRWWKMTTTCTTLMHAAYSGSAEVLKLIIDHLHQQGEDMVEQLSIRDDRGRTALHLWADGGRGAADTLQILLEAGADVDVRDKRGQTALNCIARCGDEAAVCALLEAGADVHISSDGTSLQATIRRGHTASADLLLSRMDPDDLDSWSAQTLGNHLVTKDSAPVDGKHVVVLHPEKFPQLSARLVKEIRRCVCAEGEGSPCEGDALSSSSDGDPRSLRSLSTSRVFKDPAFLRVFLRHQQNAACLHLLLASSSRHRPHLTFLFLAAASGQDALVCEVLSSCDVQPLPGFSDHLDRVLYAACCSRSPAAARALLAAGARADYRTACAPDEVRRGWWRTTWMMTTTCTTLMHAAYSGSTEVLRLVLDHLQQQREDVVEQLSIRDNKGRTALHWWAEGGRGADTLQILLDVGAAIDARDDKGHTALHQAAEIGRTAIARLLVEAGANVDVGDDKGRTALHQAAEIGHTAIARLLVEAGANVDVGDDKGHTALHQAAEIGHTAIARLLVEAGANVDVGDDKGRTALHQAAEIGHTAIARLLVEAGANVDVGDDKGHTALHQAAEIGRYAIARLLVEAGANVDVGDDKGHTALHQAAEIGHTAIARLLVEAGANVDVGDDKGRTALHHAAAIEDTAIARLLVEAGAAIDVRNKRGQTALHHAAEIGRTVIARLLVEAGADVHLRASSSSGYRSYTDLTPLEVAGLLGNTDVAAVIRSIASK